MSRAEEGDWWTYEGPDLRFSEIASEGRHYLIEHPCDSMFELLVYYRENWKGLKEELGDPDDPWADDYIRLAEIARLERWLDVLGQLLTQPPGVTRVFWGWLEIGVSIDGSMERAIDEAGWYDSGNIPDED